MLLKYRYNFSLLLLLLLIFSPAFTKNALAIDPSPTPLPTTPSVGTGVLTPNYRDPEIPQVQSLVTSWSKTENQLSVMAELTVKIKSNTLNYIEINLLPKSTGNAVNPKLIPPCVKLGSIKATTTNVGGDMQTLQSRSITPDKWYLEKHVVGTTLKLPLVLYPTSTPTYQDLCDGQYVISTIILKNAANRTLTLTANAASTAAATAAGTKSRFTDAPIMQTDFWADGFSMPCTPTSNLAPVTTTTTVNGRSTSTTSTPPSSPTIRTPCNQVIDFGKVYINVGPGPSGDTSASGTTKLPIIDYVTEWKDATTQNKTLTRQVEILTKQVSELKDRITFFQQALKSVTDNSTPSENMSLVDYRAKAEVLQKQVDELRAQLSQTRKKQAASNPTTKAPTKPSTKLSATPKASSQSNSKGTWPKTPTPRPTLTRHGRN
jgi:cell fate (sporulation/competence/biofilm development) regulator YmcA (YheA/YmcA/DUF963 family)